MRKWAAALALILCLSGCGGRESASLLGRASKLEEDAVLLTVDGREVPAWRYLYWLAFTCDQIREEYRGSGLTLDWETPVTGGTLADYAKDQALADTALYATVETWAERFGCALSEAERTAMAEDWAEQCASRGGEEAYLAALASRGLDRARAEELTEVGMLYARLCRLFLSGDPELAALREPAPAVDRILVLAGEDREAARARAEELFSRLNGGEDPAVFSALAAEGDDQLGPRTLQTLDPALEEAVQALEEGQYSGIVESDEGFSILRRLPAGEAPCTAEEFDLLLQAAVERALVKTTEGYDRLDAADFDTALNGLREGEKG